MTNTRELVRIDTTVETCGVCGKVARNSAVIRETDERGSFEFKAAGKCARLLLGYDPFAAATS